MRGRLDKKGASVDCQTNAPTGLDIWYPFHFVSQSYVERYKHKCIAVSANIGDPISTKKVISNFVICQVHFHHRVLPRRITRIFWLSHRELVRATRKIQRQSYRCWCCVPVMTIAKSLPPLIIGITLAVNLAVTLGRSRRVNVIWMVRDPEIIEFYLRQR